MELLIITGLSGAGKTRAADICEDLDYYCVDNLPAALLPRFAALCAAAQGRYERVALVMDVRSVSNHEELVEAMDAIEAMEERARIIYLEADTDTILRRYKESRRRHPMGAPGEDIRNAIARETELLAPLRARADTIIDTTGMSLNRLKGRIRSILTPEDSHISVTVTSFGYKHGIPPEADLVFDVRCLPNPYYEDSLRALTGLDSAVTEYIFKDAAAQTLLDKLTELLVLTVPMYVLDRPELAIAIGCTGGHHRSVSMAEALCRALQERGIAAEVRHRDMER